MTGKSIPEATASESRVPKSTVESAVDALLKYKAAKSANEKLQLLPQDDYIYLNLTLKKIPSNPRTSPYKISLPFPILDHTSEVCLIIDDRPKSTTPPSDQIKKLIKSQNIQVSKVIRLSKLKTNYKPFEAKRKLCDSYDMFLVDKRVVHLLPKLIGKEFFKKKKLPLGVDLSKKNLKSQVEGALGSAFLYLRTGTCCVLKVGKVAMERDEIVDNVVDAINGVVQRVPKKWDGVRSLHLKFYDSVALPVYQVMPDVKLKIEGLKQSEAGDEVAYISGNESEVSEEKSGKSEGKKNKKTKKGRIHEVRYMDVGEEVGGEEEDDDDDDQDGIEKGQSEDIDEFENKVEEKDLSAKERHGKKRNKAKTLKEGGRADKDRRVKKKVKLEKVEGTKSKKERLSSSGVKGKKIK